ncbi:MAG: hypothetical protein HF312_17095 [Ignavibacteria bacterium]|jgi:hypothetical protein|nr:hypothetical protein [Ignavibacteria bacterium]
MSKKVAYLKSLDATQPNEVRVKIAASQTILAGDLISITSGKGVKAGAAATGILGIATQDITTGTTVTDADAILVIAINERSVVRMSYVGTTKTSLVDTDMYLTAFDIDANQNINLDDTTGGAMLVVGYNNTNKTADVVIKRSALWNS